jgi:predicted DNA-binding protein
MEQKEKLTERVFIRLTPAQKEEVDELARKHKQTTSTFIRNAIINYINYLKIYHPNDNSEE